MLQESRISLLRIVEYYNFVREKTEKCEFDIIAGHVEVIAADLAVLMENFTWINFGMWTFVHSFLIAFNYVCYVIFKFSTYLFCSVILHKQP